MMNIFKENWNVVMNTMIEKPMVFALAIASILICIGLALLTIYIVPKYKFLQYPFMIFIAFLIANFYIEILIRFIKMNT